VACKTSGFTKSYPPKQGRLTLAAARGGVKLVVRRPAAD